MDIRQNDKYAGYLRRQNWILTKHNGVFYYIKKILFFSVIKVQRPKKISFEIIEKLSKKYKALLVVVEPNTKKGAKLLLSNGWQQVEPFIPSKTIVLNLAKSQKVVFDSFSKHTRYSIRKSEHIKVLKENDLEKFRKYWKAAVDYRRHVLSTKQMQDLKNVFGKESLFLIAEGGVSGAIFLVAGDTGYYWYGFANKEGRKRLSQYKVVWEGIKWAKGRGAKYFDMEGIYDERFPLPNWRGFTRFKRGFGGKVIEYPGAYRKFYIHSWCKTGGQNS